MVRGLLLMLVVAGLAGCAESETAGTAGGDNSVAVGVLSGVVLDEAINPLPGAEVRVTGDDRINITDSDGQFMFDDMGPGTYTVIVTLDGYLETQVVASISETQTPTVKVVLPVDAEARAFFTPYHFQGYFECGVWPTNGCANINILTSIVLCQYGLCLGNVTSDRSIFLQWLDSRPDFIQTEMLWDSTQPAGDALSVQLGGANEDEMAEGMAPKYNTTEGVSPLTLTLGGETLEESSIGVERAFLVRVSSSVGIGIPGGCVIWNPCGPGVQLLQDYDLFTHTFNGYVPPADWRFVESGAPPGP